MNIQSSPGKKLFVLDTNVLMHDPTALFRFQEHDIFIPMIVLEELDRSKKGLSELARNVRQVSRFLDELIQGANQEIIDNGIPLTRIEHAPQLESLEPPVRHSNHNKHSLLLSHLQNSTQYYSSNLPSTSLHFPVLSMLIHLLT